MKGTFYYVDEEGLVGREGQVHDQVVLPLTQHFLYMYQALLCVIFLENDLCTWLSVACPGRRLCRVVGVVNLYFGTF